MIRSESIVLAHPMTWLQECLESGSHDYHSAVGPNSCRAVKIIIIISSNLRL